MKKTNKTNEVVFNISKEFNKYPSGRYKSDGEYTGEHLKNILHSMLISKKHYIIELDETLRYSSAFIEEAFGGLAKNDVNFYFTFKSKNDVLLYIIQQYMK